MPRTADSNEFFAGLTYDEALQRVMADPSTHFALRHRILQDQGRDPVDSLNDAEVLCAVQRLRLGAVLERSRRSNRGHPAK